MAKCGFGLAKKSATLVLIPMVGGPPERDIRGLQIGERPVDTTFPEVSWACSRPRALLTSPLVSNSEKGKSCSYSIKHSKPNLTVPHYILLTIRLEINPEGKGGEQNT